MLVKQPGNNKWSTPFEHVFYVVCSIRGSQVTARRVTDGRKVCRDASQFKLVNAVINTTDEPEKNEKGETPQAVPDIEIPEKKTRQDVTRKCFHSFVIFRYIKGLFKSAI